MRTVVRILLVEDSRSDAALLQEYLSEQSSAQYDITHAQCWAEARGHLRRGGFDVLLLDLSLPDSSSRNTFLTARAEAPDLPIVVLTGMEDESIGLDAVRHGIQDYLTKQQSDGRSVTRAIRYAIERKQVETELRRARVDLEARVKERTTDLARSVEVLEQEVRQRKTAERALRESEERYRTLFESAPVGIGISDRQGKVLALNRRLCAMAGLKPKDAETVQAKDLYANTAQRRELLNQLRKAGKVEDQEVLLKRMDGTTLLCSVRMEETQVGRRQLILTTAQDITRQKQIEKHVEGVAALLELFATKASRQEYLAAVVEFLSTWCGCRCVGVRLLDAQGLLPYAANTGFSRSFLKHEGKLSIATPEGCSCVRMLTRRPRLEDQELISLNGSLFCNHTSHYTEQLGVTPQDCSNIACVNAGYESIAHAPIRYQGQLLGSIHLADPRGDRFPPETVAFIESVAPLVGEAIHRFQIEEALQQSEEQFRSMFERHDAVMLLVEPGSGAIEDANPAAAAFYGYPRERLRTMKIEDLSTLSPQGLASQRREADRGERDYFVFPHRLASGEVRTVEVHSSPLHVKGRQLLFSIIHDITERRLLEKQVLNISEKERQRLGQDLHDSLGGRLAGAALMGKALAQRLARKDISEAALAEEVVQCINESISQTRSLARGLCPVELGSAGLLGGLQEFASEINQHFGVTCHFHADQDLVIQDLSVASHLFRIVQEAVNNAIRHGSARTIGITLERAGGQVCLEVRDDGTGLPQNLPAHRGLGLRTMRYRAGILGGQLNVKPAKTGGTLVSCVFPFAAPPNPDQTSPEDKAPQPTKTDKHLCR